MCYFIFVFVTSNRPMVGIVENAAGQVGLEAKPFEHEGLERPSGESMQTYLLGRGCACGSPFVCNRETAEMVLQYGDKLRKRHPSWSAQKTERVVSQTSDAHRQKGYSGALVYASFLSALLKVHGVSTVGILIRFLGEKTFTEAASVKRSIKHEGTPTPEALLQIADDEIHWFVSLAN